MGKKAKKEKIKIALIDSGIDRSVNNLSKYLLDEYGFDFDDNAIIKKIVNKPILHSHGTGISLIIKTLCPNIEFISYNILNQELVGDGRILIHAINHAIIQKPRIIHLSLGTKKWIYKRSLKKLVNSAKKENIFIVAAVSNDQKRSYPAFLKDVIGVKSSRNFDPISVYYQKNFFYAPSEVSFIKELSNLKNGPVCGNSAAAAYITGCLANILLSEEHNDFDEIIFKLKKIIKCF